MAVNRIAYFLAGTLLGATAVALSKSEKGQKILSSVVQGACQVSETMMERVEVLKEDIEDYLAEAKHTKASCVRAESAAESATASSVENPTESPAESVTSCIAECVAEPGPKEAPVGKVLSTKAKPAKAAKKKV